MFDKMALPVLFFVHFYVCLWRVESFKLGVCSRLAMPKQKPLDK